MCRNIQALVHTFVLTPASCPERVCRHGKSVFGSSVNSLLIDHKVHVSRMFEMSPRDLWQSWKRSWGVFVIAWVWSFWWDGFWTLKRPGKFLLTTAHAHHLARGPNSVFCPEFFGFKCCKSFASLTSGRNQCDRAVWTGWKKMLNSRFRIQWMSVDTLLYSKGVHKVVEL